MPLRRLPPTEYRRHIPCFMQISWLAHADLPSVSSRYAAGGQRLLRVGCTACAHRQLSLTLHPRPSRPPCSTTTLKRPQPPVLRYRLVMTIMSYSHVPLLSCIQIVDVGP